MTGSHGDKDPDSDPAEFGDDDLETLPGAGRGKQRPPRREPPQDFEDDLGKRLEKASREQRFAPADHRLDVLGTCARCHSG